MNETSMLRSKRWKIGIIASFAVLFSYSLGKLLIDLVPGAEAPRTWGLFAVALLWFASLIMAAFFVSERRIGMAICGGAALALLVGSGGGLHPVSLVGALLASLLFMVGFSRARGEIENSLKIKFPHIAYRASHSFLTGISFFIAFIAVLGLLRTELTIPRGSFNTFLEKTEPVASAILPGFRLDASVHDAVEDIVRARSEPTVPDAVVEQTVSQAIHDFSETFGVDIDPEESVNDVLYEVTGSRIETIPDGARAGVLAGIGVLLFLVVRSILLIFGFIAVGFSYLIYQISFALGVMRVEQEERRKEVIIL